MMWIVNTPAPTTHIRPLTTADAQLYRALMLQAYGHPDAFTSTPDERANWPDSFWLQRLAHPQGLSVAIGAWLDDQLVGAVTLEFNDRTRIRHKAHLVGMYVQPDAQGQGAGKRLLAAALACAQARPHIRLVNLTVTEGNTAALALYARAGFQAFGTEPLAIHTPQGFRNKVHMWCPVNMNPTDLHIRLDDLTDPRVAAFMEEHLSDMRAASPPESVHALDMDALRQPHILFWTVWSQPVPEASAPEPDARLLGTAAIKLHGNGLGEIKSMRTHARARGQGLASRLLHHLLAQARQRGLQRLSLETGAEDFFAPARALYERHGFAPCPPFADYWDDPNSRFYTLEL